jgi:hypothetical protein
MKLILKEQSSRSPQYFKAAAFIRVSASDISCYAMPESQQSVLPVGLFVVFKKAENVDFDTIQEPYTCVSGGLYIPANATLHPQVGDNELSKILIWDVQVFHPNIGFVGFTEKDKLDLMTLVNMPNAIKTTWDKAKLGVPFRPPLTEIRLKPVTINDVLSNIKDEIERKPLSEIPEDDTQANTSELEKLVDNIKRTLLKGGMSALEKLGEMTSNTDGTSRNSREGGGSGNNAPTLGDKLHNWFKNNLDLLEKKRNDEINRLLNLFDKDMDEALKYALPLDNPYMNRGEAPPSDALGRRSTDFSLSNLGGGGRVDGWDLGDNYYTLQQKYRQAADKAVLKKDFKKAAYIYANLLADFHAAARVLEQGKYYKEAAVLYKEHLGNTDAAAGCLEKGGLITEAIELYDSLNSYEKVGDLYQKIEQSDKAKRYYEKGVDALLLRSNFMDAARIEDEKMNEKERAMATLLRGWRESNQPETCLKQYFNKAKTKNDDTLTDKIKAVFDTETPKSKRITLLNVLGQMVGDNKGVNKDEKLLNTTRDIAYDILSESVENGNIVQLHHLKKFLPEDRLIGSDLSLFVHQQKEERMTPSVSQSFHLNSTIKWVTAASHRNQYVVLGLKNEQLHLVRGNWYGNFEYYSWEYRFKNPDFRLILNQYASKEILIFASEQAYLNLQKMSRNKYFDSELEVGNGNFNPNFHAIFATARLFDGSVCFLTNEQGLVVAQEYSSDGSLRDIKSYTFSTEFQNTPRLSLAEMFHKHNQYYAYKGHIIFSILIDSNTVKELVLDVNVHKMTMTLEFQAFRMAVITDGGCLIIQAEFEEQKVRDFDFFAANIEPIDLKFITEDKLVVMGHHKFEVYQVNNTSAVFSKSYHNDKQKAIALLNTNDRHKFVILSENGLIQFYDL